MAPPSCPKTSALVLFFAIVFNLSGLITSAIELFGDSSFVNYRQPVILPLLLNISSHINHHRRDLRQSEPSHTSNSTARMRLYDDLLSNGYYTTRVGIGTPPQEFALIVDTGSAVTYVPCSDCKHCGKHQDPRFKPKSSSSYKPVKCNRNCICNNDGVQCTYMGQYAERSSSSGVLGEDIISFGTAATSLLQQRAVFGCENVETGEIYSQRADGILGLGRGKLSVVDQLVDNFAISDSFSLCYGGMDVGGGAMILGGISPPSGMVFSRSDPYRSPYYNIELREIRVAGKSLRLNPRVFDGNHGTVLDSGTTYAYLPEKAFVALKNALVKRISSLKQIPGPNPNYNDICFSGAGRDVYQLSRTFPEIDLVFSKSEKMSLSPENYLFRHKKVSGAYCLGIFHNGKDQTTLLGGIVVRNTLVTYDRRHDKIGFWKTNCSEFWKRMESPSSPASSPLSSKELNSSCAVPLARSGLPQNVFPGEYKIRHIIINMSFRLTNSLKESDFKELADLIAHGLEINASQVYLLDYTSRGNESIIVWSIFLADSGNDASNSIAMVQKIIMRLRNHQLHLPKRFGAYHLVEWKIEPEAKLTWWRRHTLVGIVGIAVIVVLILSSTRMWLARRHRRLHTLYEPVGASVPEQELQRL